jgi:predicted nucleic acid-binding protein
VELIEILGKRVALDTAVFIYFIEEHPRYLPVVQPIFLAVDSRQMSAVTSELTLLEILVVPYRNGDLDLAERYERLLTHSRGLHLAELTRPLLRSAAQLRARLGVKTPDSIQLAAAMSHRCQSFVTNDRELPQIPSLRIVQLAELAE